MSHADDIYKKIRPFKVGESYRALLGYHVYKIYIEHIMPPLSTPAPDIIIRYYGKTRQWWHREMYSALMLDLYCNQGEEKDAKEKLKKNA
jgi:hypothetical protein